MKVGQLFEIMEDLMEQGKSDMEVQMLHQPHWPFYLSIARVGTFDDKILLVENEQEGYGCNFDEVEDV